MIAYSIVIPVFNSEASLAELMERIHTTMVKIGEPFEVICVEDYSRDGSWKKLKTLKEEYGETIKIIALAKNFGQHSAIFCGMTYASGQYIITIDDDLQYAPEDIPLLLETIKNGQFEVVYGTGKQKKSKFRKFASWLWRFFTRIFDHGSGKGSSFRIMKSRVKNSIIKHPQGVIFIDEILQWHTHSVGFVEVEHYARKYGKSNYGTLNLISFMTSLSFSYSTVPLHLLSLFGAMISFLSFCLGLWFIFKKFYLGVQVQGFTALIVTILFSSSLLLLGIGLIGRYLNQIFILLNNKPSFSVNEEHL